MAEMRLDEAKSLLDLGKWGGAYSLAGYALELALKACIIKALMATDAFPGKEFSKNCYTQDIEKLVGLARLQDQLKIAADADSDLKMNWTIARNRSEETRLVGVLAKADPVVPIKPGEWFTPTSSSFKANRIWA